MLKNIPLKMLPLMLAALIALNGCGKGNADSENPAPAENDSTAQSDSAKTDSTKSKDKKKGEEESKELELVPVEIQTAQKGDISQYLILSANLKTEEQVSVYPEVGGIVRAILTDEGDRVNEGDTLLILDDEDRKLDHDAALVDYRQREAELERATDLLNKNFISEEAYDQAKFNLERARIAYERAELELSRTRVIAPIAGYIAQRTVNRGDLVNTGTQLYRLVNPQDMIAEVHIPESEIPRIDRGHKVKVSSDVYPDKTFPANIKRISPVVEETSGTFRVTVGVHDTGELLKPGMFVNIRIVTAVHQDVVLVPKQAVVYENDLPFIYIIQDSLALKIRLHPGFDDNRSIEALDIIQPGDKIVVVGQSGLKDSAMVKIIDLEQIRKEAMEMAKANGDKLKEKKKKKSEDKDKGRSGSDE